MSTQTYDDTATDRLETEAVEVHRNGGLAAAVGAVAAVVAIAWLARAVQSGSFGNWATFAVTATIAGVWLRAFVDARTPLLVADRHGVRLRLGQAWHGLPWHDLERVEHHPRGGIVRDGRLVLVPFDGTAPQPDLTPGGRIAVWSNRRVLGAPLALPLGITTRVPALDGDLTVSLRRLAAGQTAVIEHPPSVVEQAASVAEQTEERARVETTGPAETAEAPAPSGAARLGLRLRRSVGAVLGGHPLRQAAQSDEFEGADEALDSPDPERELRTARRSDVISVTTPERAVPLHGRELRRPGSVNLVEESEAFVPAPQPFVVAEEPVVEPAPEPVIGPELTAARERLGLSIETVAERTRIRPHVIEAIEVDDFAPCGGDFYARGHLRTLARILGIDAVPLVTSYDERYADAPIDPRRVFEAELATGTGGVRRTAGGPRWSVLVAAAMAVILAWSVARLLMDDATDVQHPAISLSQGSGGPNSAERAAQRVTVKVTAVGSSTVTVSNKQGKVVFSGDLTVGDIHRIDVVAPVTVKASDGGVVEVEIDGDARGTLGDAGQQARRTYRVAR